MTKRFPIIPATILLFLIAAPAPVAAKDSWVSVHSKNFFLIGNASDKEVRQVAVRLEQFREVFTRLFPRMNFNSPVPTTVIVFKNDSSYRPFKPNPNLAGYFQPGPDVNYITLTTEVRGEQDPFTVIFHEYTHLLVNNTLGNAPVWFNEGLAEYYSTFSVSDDQKVVLGKPIGGHVFLLRDNKMLPLRTLFQVDYKSPHYNERNKQSIFYAESWALMHYLIIGKEGRQVQLGKFLDLINSNVSMEQAFQEAFQMTFEAMEKELRDYVRQDRYKIVEGHFQRKLETDTSLQSSAISEAEAQAYLGDLLLHNNRKDCVTYLQKALELDPNLALAHAALGVARLRDGKPDEARASLEGAVAFDSQNYLIHYYYAYVLSGPGADNSQPVNGITPEVAKKISDELHKTIQLRPDYPEAYSLLAYVTLMTGENIEDVQALLKRALAKSPGRNDLVFMLAQLYLRSSDYTNARQLLEQVTKSNAQDETRQQAQSLLTQVVQFQQRQQRLEADTRERASAGAASQQSTFTVDATSNNSSPSKPVDPSSYLREALRTPAAGETQLQGTLVRIDCDSKGIVFVVNVGNQVVRLRTAGFDDIEITTYNPDVNGEIACGRKSEESVVICFVPHVDKRTNASGVLKSIEFVPRDFKLKP